MYYIYFIREKLIKPIKRRRKKSITHGYVKIGVAIDVEGRIKGLQTGNPRKLELIAIIPFKSKAQCYGTETDLHKMFSDIHIHGEWFKNSIKFHKVEKLYPDLEYILLKYNNKIEIEDINNLDLKLYNENMEHMTDILSK